MAFMNLAPSRPAGSFQSFGVVEKAATARRRNTWHRTVLEAAGTFLLLAGIAIGILTLRFVLVLFHGVML
jgi:hypothetical protein